VSTTAGNAPGFLETFFNAPVATRTLGTLQQIIAAAPTMGCRYRGNLARLHERGTFTAWRVRRRAMATKSSLLRVRPPVSRTISGRHFS